MEQENINGTTQSESTIKIQELLFLCLTKWYWFVISLAICLGLAAAYLLTTPPVYTRTASILIKDEKGGRRASDALESMFDMGVFNSNTNINNEIGALSSPDLMLEVVKRLHLYMNYKTSGRFYKPTLYGTNLPINATFLDIDDGDAAACHVVMQPDGHLLITDFKYDNEGEPAEDDTRVECTIGDTVATPIGRIHVVRTPEAQPTAEMDFFITKSSLNAATKAFSSSLNVTQDNDKSTIILLTDRDVSVQRANDVLNAIIAIYNENWVKDRNQIAVSTSMFINDRLGVIESELGNVDSDISSYKSEHLLPDVQAVATMYMSQASEANAGIKDLNNQVYMARYVRNYLTNDANRTEMIPVTSGIDNANLTVMIKEYNDLLMERNGLVAHSSERNPLVQEMDNNLQQLRVSLVKAIDNQIVALETQIKSLQGFGNQARSQIASNPQQAKYLLSVERQQKVKESLYLYLLQKREENELSQAFTAYNTRVIAKPNGSPAPTSPKRAQILLLAFVIGLALPVGGIYLRESLNTVVRGRKDIESLTAPFVGEIPQNGGMRKHPTWHRIINRITGRKDKNAEGVIVVKPKSRNTINEAFRVVRTNLEFMLGNHQGCNVVALTSANPGSGKTFISFNLAYALAIKDKRVLLIDLDLRKGSLSKYVDSPKTGIANYLAGRTDNVDSIIVRHVKDTTLDVIPMGIMPPNPTELLFNGRLDALITELRPHYDFIFIDCPPVEIVADAAIINKVVDTTIFVVRAGLFERTMLPEVEQFYRTRRYHNMAILLNGTDGGIGRYGSRYGYRYGYKYGYSYGYSNYYTDDKDDNNTEN